MAGCWVKASGTSRLQSKWNEPAFRTVDAYQKQKSLANNCHWSRISMDFSVPISAATATLSERRVKQNCICVCLSVLAWWYTVQINVYPLSIFPAPTHPTWMCIAFSKAPDSALLLSMCRYLLLIQHTPHVFRSVLYLGSWSYSIWFHVSSRKMIALDSTIV